MEIGRRPSADVAHCGRRRQTVRSESCSRGQQTLLCTYLSAVLLAGLVLNTAFGWAWADPITGLVIAGIAVKEGIDAW